MKSALNRITILVCIVLIASCGFRLRGSGESYLLSPQLANLELTGSNINSDLMYMVQNNLASSGVIVNGDVNSLYTLVVIDQGVSERNTTFGADARTTEKEVRAKAQFTLKSKDGNFVYGPHDIENERTYDYDVSSVNSADRERDLIIAELRRSLADQILRMLQAVQLPNDSAANSTTSSNSAATNQNEAPANTEK
jgi:outer membrane lipopolysaccharide assembly protein LptE/RlpB